MATFIKVSGAAKFISLTEKLVSSEFVVYFTAAKKEDGIPWCPDCAEADPVVTPRAAQLNPELTFVQVRIDRPYWKENAESNRLKNEFGIKCLPTLMRWNQPERLGEDECKSVETVESFLAKQK